MDAAEVWLEILKIFPYVAVAGFAGAAALAAYHHRVRPLQEGGPSGAMPLVGDGTQHPERLRAGSRGWGRRAGWLQAAVRSVARRVHLSTVLTGGVVMLGVALSLWLLRPAPGLSVVKLPLAARGAAASDGGLRFGALTRTTVPETPEVNEPADVAWLFGALVSGGRSGDAWALLTPEAQRATSTDNFVALLGSAYLLRGSDDVPWRVPGSNVFLFSLSDREKPAALKGELRVALAAIDGQWRVASFKLRGKEPAR